MSFVELALAVALLGPTASRIDADVTTVLSRMHVPGATIEVARDGDVAYRKAYGFRDAENRQLARVDTPYEIGSITKQFTAAAILQLRDAGKLDLDATLRPICPAYRTQRRSRSVNASRTRAVCSTISTFRIAIKRSRNRLRSITLCR